MKFVRILNLLAFVLLFGSAVAVYRIKYDAIFHAEDVARLERAIEAERASIILLKTEWARLARPDRIEAMARDHLGLTVSRPEQTVKLSSLPGRPEAVDPIAQTIESLGLEAAQQADPIANAIDALDAEMNEPVTTGSTR